MITMQNLARWLAILVMLESSVAYGEATDAGAGANSECAKFGAPTARGKIDSKKIDEASGIAASHRNPGVFYVHNDSGDKARVFAIDESGRDLGRYHLDGVIAIDWEDIAVGPAANETGSFIYLGDIGDNEHSRATINIVRVPEPVVDPKQEAGKQELSGAIVLSMQYPHGNAHNAEALLLDPQTSDLFLITKVKRGLAKIFRYPAPHDPARTATLEEVGNLKIGTHPVARANSVTGADISFARNQIAVRTYSQVLVWKRKPGESIAQAMSRPACFVLDHSEPQGEAVGWTLDGSAFVTVSEGSKQPIYVSASRP